MTKLLFHEIQDGVAIIRRGGVYKQVGLFHRDGRVYAEASGGYIRIGKQGTSVAAISVDAIDGVVLTTDQLGWYEYKPGKLSNLRSVS